MKPFLYFILRTALALPITIGTWLLCFFAYDQTFLVSSAISLVVGGIVFYGVKWMTNRSFLKENHLTRKEYIYIQKNLEEAKAKINRLQKVFVHIRSLHNLRQMLTINRLVKRIYAIVKKEPRRFYQAERFFFYHLDSIVELTEKYAFLANQPLKDEKMYQQLSETRQTIEDLSKSIENDLYQVLSTDIDHLDFELDVAKHSLKRLEHPLFDDERRTTNERKK